MQIKTLRYNTYSNRECIGYSTASEYDEYVVDNIRGVNFIPGDGVNTEIVLNLPTAHSDIDYLLAVEDGLDIINSRWFIMDCTRLRNGQYKLSLYRDTLYDYKTEIASSTGFIKRGWITDINNPLLLNQEEFTTNQVVTWTDNKAIEKLTNFVARPTDRELYEAGPWIVGYLSKNAPGTKITVNEILDSDEAIILPESLAKKCGWDSENPKTTFSVVALPGSNNQYSTINTNDISYMEIKVVSKTPYLQERWGSYASYEFVTDTYIRNNGDRFYTQLNPGNWTYTDSTVADELGVYLSSQLANTDFTNIASKTIPSITDVNSYVFNTELVSYTNKDAYIAGYRYQVTTTTLRPSIEICKDLLIQDSDFSKKLANILNASGYVSGNITADDVNFYVSLSVRGKQYTFSPKNYAYTINIPAPNARSKAGKAPYDIFALKANWENTGSLAITYKIAQEISKVYSGSRSLYDLQLVPYINLYGSTSNNIEKSGISTGNKFYWLDVDANAQSVSLTQLEWTTNPLSNNDDAVKRKILNQTRRCRIVSQNHGQIKEFNPTHLGTPFGYLANNFLFEMTLKPYSPMFAIGLPVWHDEADYRGELLTSPEDIANWLIITGDFSLPQTSDAWETYQINNKNYLNAFNRQIESVELNNKYAKVHDVANAISGTVSAAVSAGTAGFAAGGPAGAAVGAIAGGVLSGAAGIADISINEKLRTDQLDLQKDMFNYNLQNIQALPNTLANVSAYDTMNYIFPYVIQYDCTDKEKAAFRNYLKYRGMSIGVIDTISAYKRSGHFIQADILKINLHEDQHLINTIREEVSKGFFDGRVANI